MGEDIYFMVDRETGACAQYFPEGSINIEEMLRLADRRANMAYLCGDGHGIFFTLGTRAVSMGDGEKALFLLYSYSLIAPKEESGREPPFELDRFMYAALRTSVRMSKKTGMRVAFAVQNSAHTMSIDDALKH